MEEVQSLLQEKHIKILEPCVTRWLSIERSVHRIKDCYVSIVLSLEREGTERCEAKAIGLSQLILEYRFVCTTLLICDVLPHITHLSKCFQIEAVDYSVIPTMLSSIISSLQQLITCDGSNFSSLQSYLQKLEQANVTVTKQADLGENYFLESIRKPFLRCLIDNLKKRFEDKSILTTFDVFDPKKILQLSNDSSDSESDGDSSTQESFMQYGNIHIKNLAEHYQGEDDVSVCGSSDECVEEWSSFKQFMHDNYLQLRHKDVIRELCSNKTISSIYPNMSTFAKICLVIPIHTAGVERTFSQLKLIKTRIRNRLSEGTLDSLLRIAVEGSSPQDSQSLIREAVELWAKKKNRRLQL